MPNNVVHFAVHADDIPRARRFYEGVFGWQFRPWGPPDFFLITTGPAADPGIHGALQKRREPVQGKSMTGYECTVSVDSVEETSAAVKEHGGKLVMPKTVISGVGTLIQFEDTESNVVCAMQYDQSVE